MAFSSPLSPVPSPLFPLPLPSSHSFFLPSLPSPLLFDSTDSADDRRPCHKIGREHPFRSESKQREMGLKEDFEEHAEKAKTLPENTTNENKLILYGLYKQATVGPVNTDRPGMFNPRDRAKWDAWKAVEGKSKDEAMSDYITKVKQLLEEAAAIL